MAANTEVITLAHSGGVYSLRGDMGLRFDLASEPTDTFNITVRAYGTSGSFPITTNIGQFRRLDDAVVGQLDIPAMPGLYATLRYNVTTKTFDIVENNLTALQAISALNAAPGGETGGDGTGTGWEPEELIMPNAQNEYVFDKAVTNNFRVHLTGHSTFKNPIGFTKGDKFRVVIYQGDTGGWTVKYDTKYGFPDSQPPVIAQGPKALVRLNADVTGDDSTVLCDVSPTEKLVSTGYGTVTELAKIGTQMFYSMADAYAAATQNNAIIQVLRNGRGSESTATFTSNLTRTVVGMALPNGDRPTLMTLADTRLSYQKAIINCEAGTTYIRDLIVTGARNIDSTSRGIAPNNDANVYLNNVKLYNNENGMLWTGNGIREMTDCLFDNNGQAGNASERGYTHNIYAGESEVPWKATRCSFINSQYGHNIKSRGYVVLRQVFTQNAAQARELDTPNGGGIDAENCTFIKEDGSSQANLIGIGLEGVITSRTRSYVFKNCRFENRKTGAGDATFMASKETVPVRFIDCEFIGPRASEIQGDPNGDIPGSITVNGLRYLPGAEPIFEYTGGPIGPKAAFPPGCPANVPLTPP